VPIENDIEELIAETNFLKVSSKRIDWIIFKVCSHEAHLLFLKKPLVLRKSLRRQVLRQFPRQEEKRALGKRGDFFLKILKEEI